MRALLIVLLVLGFPVLEAWVLFRLGEVFGWWVVAWLVAAVVAGVLLIRFEKLAWALRVAQQLRQQQSPVRALLASARTLVAGVLLVFPGVVSDVLALVVLLWPLPGTDPLDPGAGGNRGAGAGRVPGVIEGEYRREDGVDRLPPGRR